MEFMPLTKKMKLENGKEITACSLFGTEMCQIHNCGDCGKCPRFIDILERLREFESVYEEMRGNTAV